MSSPKLHYLILMVKFDSKESKQDFLDVLRFEDEGGPCTPSCYMHHEEEE
jgi:hypothetical protein